MNTQTNLLTLADGQQMPQERFRLVQGDRAKYHFKCRR